MTSYTGNGRSMGPHQRSVLLSVPEQMNGLFRGEHCSLLPERPASRNRTADGAILIVDLDFQDETTPPRLVQTLAPGGYHVSSRSQLNVALNLLKVSECVAAGEL